MEDTRVTFETAKLAKEKGFEFRVVWEYILGFKEDSERDKYLPTQSLLAKWLREKYDIEINITRMPPEAIKSSFNKGNKRIKKYNMWVWNLNGNPRIENPSLFFDNYEEALEIGLQEALKLINSDLFIDNEG